MDKEKDIIEIYPSLRKAISALLLIIPFILGGWIMAIYPETFENSRYYYWKPMIVAAGWLFIISFGFAEVTFLWEIGMRLLHIPVVRIYQDRLECYIFFKFRYETYLFSKIDHFFIGTGRKNISTEPKESSISIKFNRKSRKYKYDVISCHIVDNIVEINDTLNKRLLIYKDEHQPTSPRETEKESK